MGRYFAVLFGFGRLSRLLLSTSEFRGLGFTFHKKKGKKVGKGLARLAATLRRGGSHGGHGGHGGSGAEIFRRLSFSSNHPRRRPRLFPGDTSETTAACFLAFLFFYPRAPLRSRSAIDDEDDDDDEDDWG
jgi:hypothetical protein